MCFIADVQSKYSFFDDDLVGNFQPLLAPYRIMIRAGSASWAAKSDFKHNFGIGDQRHLARERCINVQKDSWEPLLTLHKTI